MEAGWSASMEQTVAAEIEHPGDTAPASEGDADSDGGVERERGGPAFSDRGAVGSSGKGHSLMPGEEEGGSIEDDGRADEGLVMTEGVSGSPDADDPPGPRGGVGPLRETSRGC